MIKKVFSGHFRITLLTEILGASPLHEVTPSAVVVPRPLLLLLLAASASTASAASSLVESAITTTGPPFPPPPPPKSLSVTTSVGLAPACRYSQIGDGLHNNAASTHI